MQQQQPSRRQTHTARRTRRQPGYALLVVLLMFSVFVIFLATAVPSWKTEIQRDRENMEIDRAHQYVEGIKRYYHKFGSYPPNLERLKETNGIHYLRQAWPDPLTPDGKWKLLQYSDLKNGEVVGGGMGLPGGMNRTRNGVGSTAAGSSESLFGGGLDMGSSLSGDTGGNHPGGGLFSATVDSDSGSGDTSGTSSTATGPNGDSTTSTTSSATSSTTSSTSTSPTSSTGTSADSDSKNRSGGLFGGTTGSTAGRRFGGAGIVGVASLSKKPAVHAFNRKHRPDQWQFVYNPMHDKSLLGPGVGNGPALGQQVGSQPGSTTNGSQGGGLFGSGTTGTTGTAGAGGTGGSTSSSGDSGAGSNPGAGLFGDSGSN